MKSLKLKKLVAAALTVATISAVSPMAASAAWKHDNRGWWNTEGNSYSTGWRQLDGDWFNFDSVGYMNTGWVQDGASWYYLNPISNGSMGAMETGWIQSPYSGKWYYMNPISDGTKGAMQTGWIKSPYSGKWYYMNPISNAYQGAMETGWINDNGTWYFADNSGAMQTGVVEINNKVYYLQPSGAMATGTVEINGTNYTFDASGACIGNTPKVDKVFNSDGTIVNTGSTNNNGNSSDSGSSSSGGGGGHHSSSGSSVVSEKTYKVTFSKNLTEKENEQTKDSTYTVKDLYVTDRSGNNYDVQVEPGTNDSEYIIKTKSGNISARAVIRKVSKDGVISYITEDLNPVRQ